MLRDAFAPARPSSGTQWRHVRSAEGVLPIGRLTEALAYPLDPTELSDTPAMSLLETAGRNGSRPGSIPATRAIAIAGYNCNAQEPPLTSADNTVDSSFPHDDSSSLMKGAKHA